MPENNFGFKEVFKINDGSQIWWCPSCLESWQVPDYVLENWKEAMDALDDSLMAHLRENRECCETMFTVKPDDI